MTGSKTTLLGRRIGTNERLRKQERVRKVKNGVSSAWHWFKRRGWILAAVVVVLAVLAIHNRFYLQRFNPLELRHLQYVEIEGNRMLSWEDVMQGAQVETGMLMSELNADSVEASLMQLPMILSAKVRTDSYVSFGSALAFYKLIGTESPFLISCVVTSKASEYKGDVNISYAKISKNMFFGTKILENGVRIATAEKAVLDTLYFYQHKKTFYFNVFQDINFSTLSKEILDSYLEHYANPRFKAFVRNTVYGEL